MRTTFSRGIVFCFFLSVGLASARAADPSGSPPKTMVSALQPFVDEHTLAGAVVLVADKASVRSLDAAGFEDVAAKKPMRPDDLFWIASMSKPMTSTALMMLVDEGKVNVDEPVEKYLPEFRGQMLVAEQDDNHTVLKHPVHPITVKNVLSHTSGLPFAPRVEHHIDQFPLSESIVCDALTALQFDPDTKYQYANAGINTAGRIVEAVSGMPYEQFMQSRLFDPLGMKDTTFWPNADQLGRLAKSYRPNAEKTGLEETDIGQLTYPLDGKNRYPSPAGGLFSTAADVARFCQMILNGGTLDGKRYLSEVSVKQMTSTHTGTLVDKNGNGGYGFGWSTSHNSDGPDIAGSGGDFGHGGAYSTNMWISPRQNLIVVYMVQHAGYPNKDGGEIWPAILKVAQGEKPSPAQ